MLCLKKEQRSAQRKCWRYRKAAGVCQEPESGGFWTGHSDHGNGQVSAAEVETAFCKMGRDAVSAGGDAENEGCARLPGGGVDGDGVTRADESSECDDGDARQGAAHDQGIGLSPESDCTPGLRAKHSQVIGLIISDIRNPFFTALMRGIRRLFLKRVIRWCCAIRTKIWSASGSTIRGDVRGSGGGDYYCDGVRDGSRLAADDGDDPAWRSID